MILGKFSVWVSFFMAMRLKLASKLARIEDPMAVFILKLEGPMQVRTPPYPRKINNQWSLPTLSPNKKIDKKEVKIGPENPMLVAVVIGK